MRVYKVIGTILIGALSLASCGSKVSQEEYDELNQEYQALKESLGAAQAADLDKAATINRTLAELAEVSGNTMVLRNNIENKTAQVKQADRISNNIQSIKKKIEDLEKQVADNAAYKKMVANLKTIVQEKEREIKSLKATIEEQNSTITQQGETISHQQEEISNQGKVISNQQELLQKAVQAQAALLYQAASEFERFAEDVPDVSKNKNKKKVKEWAISMLTSARLYYEKSQEYGTNTSNDIARVKRRISSLQREIN